MRADRLARDIMTLSANMLRVRFRFLDLALGELKPVNVPGYALGTDGQKLYYGAGFVLRRYKEQQDGVAQDLLHLAMHCILRHMFVGPVEVALWDLACDIAVENALLELQGGTDGEKHAVLEWLEPQVAMMTAEHLYRFLRESSQEEGQAEALSTLFRADDHWPWYLQAMPGEGEGWQGAPGDVTVSAGKPGAAWESRWKTLGERMQVDLETGTQWGDKAGSLLQNLGRLNREKYDYTDFLKKFAVMGEAMKLSDDEFDQNFYTYGLRLYENLPLIEPLEYRDMKRIREFVVAIDTSGSVAGELVQRFVQKTYNVLKTTESFANKINLHIIQCDAAIQEDAKITTQEELDRYLEHMTLRGFGGTDFRPVFRYVDKLIRDGEFLNLKGLIYFTDGYGTFPERKPDYEAAFVFVDSGREPPKVPVWAIRLVLPEEEV